MNTTIQHNGKTYNLLDDENLKSEIESIGSKEGETWGEVYWIYKCEGLHNGEPIEVAVKNPHYEADGDDYGVYYYFTEEGWFWADDMTEIDENVEDWYHADVMELAKLEYNESADN